MGGVRQRQVIDPPSIARLRDKLVNPSDRACRLTQGSINEILETRRDSICGTGRYLQVGDLVRFAACWLSPMTAHGVVRRRKGILPERLVIFDRNEKGEQL